MCSFCVTNKKVENIEYINKYIQKRGPDLTTQYYHKQFTFIHNLLSITGKRTPQPFISSNIICTYNGQIYNHDKPLTSNKDLSDGECIIPLYKKYGPLFTQHLDGEFALVLIDFNKNKIIISSDIFRTKPIWYAINNKEIGVASYKSCLQRLNFKNIKLFKHNTTCIYDLNKLSCINQFKVFSFDLNQHKSTFKDWNTAFKNAIKKRTHSLQKKLFIGLSSGYDSGAISCELNNQKIPYKAFTILGKEDISIVNKRVSLINKHSSYQLLKDNRFLLKNYRLHYKKHLIKNIEPYYYTIHSSSSDYTEHIKLHDDSGSLGLSYVCATAKKENYKVYLSGQGADEIFSDYGFQGIKKYPHSNFGGLFPENLEEIFPWASFYNSSMESYIAKEEYVAGSYGIETRYPFLDRYVVQEFLWLTNTLKNSHYKSVLYNFLTYNKYPFLENIKTGF